jgi:histidinol-phosphate phosphatase family domain/HAD-superfamily hydrolase, subfamily IIIA
LVFANSFFEVHAASLDGTGTVLEGSNRVILLDRDGVLNVDRPDSVKRVDELEIEAGAIEGCAILRAGGFQLCVITNQSAVGRGWMDRAALDAMNTELNRRLGGGIDHWYVCDHSPDDGCRCRKPDTLLLEQAQADLGFIAADTWFVADAGRDIEAARRFGCRPALVLTGKGTATAVEYPDLRAWADLAAFARFVTNTSSGES